MAKGKEAVQTPSLSNILDPQLVESTNVAPPDSQLYLLSTRYTLDSIWALRTQRWVHSKAANSRRCEQLCCDESQMPGQSPGWCPRVLLGQLKRNSSRSAEELVGSSAPLSLSLSL